MAHARCWGGIATLALTASVATGGCSSGGDAPASTAAATSTGAGGAAGSSSSGSDATSTASSTTAATGAGGSASTTAATTTSSSTSTSSGAGGSSSGAGGGSTGAGGSGTACTASASSASFPPPAAFKCTTPAPNATAPAATWVNVTGNLANMASECGNLTMLSAEPCTNMVIAGVAKGGLWATTDAGKTWTKLGSGAGSASIIHRPSSIVYDPDHQDVFWESGIYEGGGVFKTIDNGQTFKQLGTISHNDLVSVDMTDPDRKTILVGGHEQKQTLYLSTDGGQTFNNIGMNLPADSHFSSAPLVLDSKNFLLGACGYGSGVCGVYRSSDGGGCWTRVGEQAVVARPLWTQDNTMYWTTVFDSGIATSTDQGKTWAQASGGIGSGYPVELPDGRVVAINNGHVAASKDKGKTWTQIGPNPPFKPNGVTYSVRTKTLFIWHNDCGNAVLSDAIASAGFDYATQ
jgi:hypothetical protein